MPLLPLPLYIDRLFLLIVSFYWSSLSIDRLFLLILSFYWLSFSINVWSILYWLGQTLKYVGIWLRTPIFTHGQLYVACSRVGKPEQLKFAIKLDSLGNVPRVDNVVFQEVLLDQWTLKNSDSYQTKLKTKVKRYLLLLNMDYKYFSLTKIILYVIFSIII